MSRFHNLTPAHGRAFERIAVNESPYPCAPKTLQALEDRGLIQKGGEVIGCDALGAIVVDTYEVPVSVHMDWCAWCSEQLTGEEE